MTEWSEHDDCWMYTEEQLGNGYWLLCFRRKPDGVSTYPFAPPDAWINVLSGKWVRGTYTDGLEIECYRAEHCDPLTLECIMIELRNKYAQSDAAQSPVAQAPNVV